MDYRIIYTSKISESVVTDVSSTMSDILVQSVRNNRLENLTGVLMSNGVWFAQVLEGPRAAVKHCLDRISADRRHNDFRLRLSEFDRFRLFERWSMCGISLAPLDDALLDGFGAADDLVKAPPQFLLQMMVGLSIRYGKTLDSLHGEAHSIPLTLK